MVVHLDGATTQADALRVCGTAEFGDKARATAAYVESDDPGVDRRFINTLCEFGHPVILTRNQGKVV
ncbi:hypothetical protein GCM10023198_41340 [Promicromonospora umidemergens]|uniref:Uncharacterized protein n=1 Tax=Promicromonospora umidemergens TaxID=629679 RepID=A0ABP8XSQ9_9MICO